jgi:hypothetical protein
MPGVCSRECAILGRQILIGNVLDDGGSLGQQCAIDGGPNPVWWPKTPRGLATCLQGPEPRRHSACDGVFLPLATKY